MIDNAGSRALTSQLSEDLSWLEQHCRQQPDQAIQAGRLRLAASVVRNCIGPFLDDQPVTPLHVVVVGGAGAGKSTVANMLSGSPSAEANPQAGFTRHPVAYTSVNGPLNWASHIGFLGPLNRLSQASPASLDADVYQVRRVPVDASGGDLLKDFIVWDCPDMTTWAASGYVPRLLEVAGLADVIVYVASDERYNDEVPTQFLHMLLETGKPVVACLMKMKEEDAPALVAHFQREVLSQAPGGTVGCLPIPQLTREQLADPARLAARHRIPLLNQVAVMGSSAAALRKRNIRGAMNFLMGACHQLLHVAREDITALQTWRHLVHNGQAEFDQRYWREYLNSEKFRSFDEALVRMIDLLDLPGVGKILSSTLWVIRTPYRLLRGLIGKAITRPETATPPEQPVLEEALSAWTDMLRKEAARRSDTHALWAHIEQGFLTGLSDMARERFQQGFRTYQLGLATEVERTARAIYEELEKRPALLNTLRGGKFAIDVAAIAGAIVAGGPGWSDLILVPLAASATHQLVELLGRQYVDSQREMTRQRLQALMAQQISNPLAEWLTQWPATGGSTYERLQLALRRIPAAVEQLDAAVTKALASTR